MRLYFRDLLYLGLYYLHNKLLARTLFSRLGTLANLCENKVLANKKCFTVLHFACKRDRITDKQTDGRRVQTRDAPSRPFRPGA